MFERSLRPAGDQSVHGERSSPTNQQGDGDRDSQQMEFEALALLPARPVHEKTHVDVNQQNRHEHVDANRERGNTREETEQQPEGAEELRGDNQPPKKCWKSHPCKQRQRAVEAAASEEAKQFLGAMRKEDYGEHNPQHGQN